MAKNGGAYTLYTFLDSNKALLSQSELLDQFNLLTANLLSDSNDSPLLDFLTAYSWDVKSKTYTNTSIDITKLSKSLRSLTDKKQNKKSALRASQVGTKNTIKSFAPDLLMIHVLQRNFHINDTDMKPFSAFFEGVVLLADISGKKIFSVFIFFIFIFFIFVEQKFNVLVLITNVCKIYLFLY